MEILINRITNNVVGLNRPATPLNIVVIVDDGFTLSKNIEEVTGYTEPLEEGQPGEPITETKYVTLETKPEAFTLEEIIQAKYKNLLNASDCDYIVADMFIEEGDLDLNDVNHSANTGVGIVQLLPNGQTKTKTIDLEAAATTFTLLEFDADPGVEVYVAGKIFTSGKAIVTTSINSCTIKFINTTDKAKMVRAYAIGY